MVFEVFLHPKARDFLKKADSKMRDAIKSRLEWLKDNPESGKPLKHCPFRSLRVCDYRVIYELDGQKIVVLFIGHRKNVYDDFSKLF